jgi:hypothetical protein
MKKENESDINVFENNPLVTLLFSKEFYISLIIPMIIGFFLCLVEDKRYIILLSYLLGLCSLPLIITIKEIFLKKDKDAIKDMA